MSRKDPEILFWRHVNKTDSCWLWTGHINKDGYGIFTVHPTRETKFTWRAHRYAYSASVGEIPGSLQLDHLCRVRHCVNPSHLEAVTARENISRGRHCNPNLPGSKMRTRTHCKKGHEYSEANTYKYKGCQVCRACSNQRAARARKQEYSSYSI